MMDERHRFASHESMKRAAAGRLSPEGKGFVTRGLSGSWLRVLSVVLTILLVQGCDVQEDAAPQEGELPNIVWITGDDLSPNLGAYGDDFATTPNLDRLAEEGVRYTNAFATAPVCSPARFTLITGIYATSAGTQGLRAHAPIPDDIQGFPSFMREVGYYTTNNVKTDYNTADEERLIEESWDESSATAHWRGREEGQPFFSVFNLMHTHQSRISFLDTEFEELEEFLGRHDPEEAPLPPYYPDEPEIRQTVARYYDAVEAMDARAGEILAQLEEDGVADNTIVMFYGDHGRGLPRGKRVLYDSGLRVPFIAYFPERWEHLAPAEAGSVTDRLVSFVDFPSTTLSLLGIDVPNHMQGQVFLGPDADAPRDYVYGARDRVDEAYDKSRSVRDGQYLYIRHYNPHRSWNQPEYFSDQAPIRQAITRRAEAGTLNEDQLTYAGPSKPYEELFDVAADPHQLDNLAGSEEHQDVLASMRETLRDWQLQTHDIGFMPEGLAMRLSAELGRTPLEFADDEEVYPIERVLETALLVGETGTVPELAARIDDPNAVVRYWAAVGLDAADAASSEAVTALQDALDDDVPEVRIAAAGALVDVNASAEGLDVLADALRSDDANVVLMAARTLQLLGPKAEPVHPAMAETLAQAQDDSVYGINALFIRFALSPVLQPERGSTEVIEGPGRDMAPGSEE